MSCLQDAGHVIDTALRDVGEMARRGDEVVVVVENGESVVRCCSADEQINDRQCAVLSTAAQSVLSGLDPAPCTFLNRDVRVEIIEHLGHVVMVAEIARGLAKLDALRVA